MRSIVPSVQSILDIIIIVGIRPSLDVRIILSSYAADGDYLYNENRMYSIVCTS